MWRWIKRKVRSVFVKDRTPRPPKPVKPTEPVTMPDPEAKLFTEDDKKGRTMLYYQALYNTTEINNIHAVERVIQRIHVHKDKYVSAMDLTGVDWRIIAVIHNLEASGDFTKQILNGERYTKRTRLVPKGWGPWDSWESSCVDAFKRHKLADNQIPTVLKFLERFNGMGYVRKGINSPYLWSYTNHYKKGKYVSDGKYSSSAVSKQVGGAAILKRLGF